METWKDVPGWENIYEVSNQGRVRSCERTVLGNWKHGKQVFKSKILKPGIGQKGHELVIFTKPGKRKTYWVHSLVAEIFIGPRPKGNQVLHWDGNPRNNRVENLRYGTQKENSADAIRHGTARALKGHKNPNAKLSLRQVRFLRKNRKQKSIRQWAEHYEISTSRICAIISGRAYVAPE